MICDENHSSGRGVALRGVQNVCIDARVHNCWWWPKNTIHTHTDTHTRDAMPLALWRKLRVAYVFVSLLARSSSFVVVRRLGYIKYLTWKWRRDFIIPLYLFELSSPHNTSSTLVCTLTQYPHMYNTYIAFTHNTALTPPGFWPKCKHFMGSARRTYVHTINVIFTVEPFVC